MNGSGSGVWFRRPPTNAASLAHSTPWMARSRWVAPRRRQLSTLLMLWAAAVALPNTHVHPRGLAQAAKPSTAKGHAPDARDYGKAADIDPTGPFTPDDLLVCMPTYGEHDILVPLSRVWRQGVRMHVTTDPVSDLHRCAGHGLIAVCEGGECQGEGRGLGFWSVLVGGQRRRVRAACEGSEGRGSGIWSVLVGGRRRMVDVHGCVTGWKEHPCSVGKGRGRGAACISCTGCQPPAHTPHCIGCTRPRGLPCAMRVGTPQAATSTTAPVGARIRHTRTSACRLLR